MNYESLSFGPAVREMLGKCAGEATVYLAGKRIQVN